MPNYFFIHFFLFLSYLLPAQDQTMGLFLNAPNSQNGYTLLSNNEFSYLIDNCGFIVNSWESEYKAGHGLYLLENGDLLRAGMLPGDFDAGGRGGIFEIFDWTGNRKWSYSIANNSEHAHHDLAPLPNGHFLCTVWEKKTEAEAQAKGRTFSGEVWSEKIIEIEPVGNSQANIIWQWSIWDHLVQDVDPAKENYGMISEYPELININYIGQGQPSSGNWLHINAIDYNEELDQIAISSRNLSEIYVIDHSTTSAEASWHIGGKYGQGGDLLFRYGNPQVYNYGSENDRLLNNQHDIRWIPAGQPYAGSFCVFNNEYLPGQQSRVQIFNNPIDPYGYYHFDIVEGFGNDDIIFSYTNDQLYSSILSGAQPLANGNLLILEGKTGHIFEIDQNENIVWDYIYPVNRNGGPGIQSGTPQFNTLFRSIRYPDDYVGFEGKDLSPIAPIELLPNESNCEIVTSTYAINENKNLTDGIRLLGNPIIHELHFENFNNQLTRLVIYDAQQRLSGAFSVRSGKNIINLQLLPDGLYLLHFHISNKSYSVHKVIKTGH